MGRLRGSRAKNSDCVFHVVRVSETMQKVKVEAIARVRRKVVQMQMRKKKRVGSEVLEKRFEEETVDVNVEMGLDDEEREGGKGSEED
ncbi:hypothetical protein AJ78_05938 [Emergomyces pasteurianus Ep9510]|uniref:Uncharacterized protein n=1 Tax=Emergomyces pasteurianus Ep9510 TaxID=1447872 RepID=A0A1J9PAR4_9EURO|nr:hypothetical protein AJ78_05938 [Emergomyces pasteurianus Ep9510]